MTTKPSPPEILELDANLVAEIQQRIAARQLTVRDHEIFAATLATHWYLANLLTQKNISIGRLQKLVFGASTEKTESVIGQAAEAATSPPAGEGGPSAASPSGPAPDAPPKRRPGHGRNGADDYPGAEKIPLPHESLQPGDSCPECGQGKLSEQPQPAVLIRFTGHAPVHAKIYQRQRLRCNLCGKVFTAQAPESVGADKYDVTVASTIGLLKYGTGMPFYRLAGLQASVGIPLPVSTQWKIVSDQVPCLCAAFQELLRQAAQSDVFYQDDTNNRILELMGKRLAKTQAEKASQAVESGTPEDDSERRGIFTSGIVATCAGHRIALFFTGRKHAGENLLELLAQRAQELGPPIQMCDPLSRNMPAELKTIVSNCLAHGRRQFADVAEYFHQECRHVLEALAVVYHNDALSRERGLSPEARLQFHQAQSTPVMDGLHAWLTQQIEQRLVEPNSGLGKAILYMLKRWSKFTLFLRQAGAPLDNNLCERALKKVILHRKNALFYKTENGAYVGDMYLSLIHTCELCGINPRDYLTELLRHEREVAANPECWMPWNYRQTLDGVITATGPPATATSDILATVP